MYDIGHHEGAPYIVSELLEGETLRQQLSAGAVPVRRAIECAVQIAHGLAAAHEKGIAHRDLKPENIFITSDGRVKILDFGLAKLTQNEPPQAGATTLPTMPANTQPGVVLGTIGYMSPEQVRGDRADHRADVFALGLILYEMLSGRRAFSGETSVETMHAILKVDPSELATPESGIPLSLDQLVRFCLEKNPKDRFQSARDLALALETVSAQSASSQKLPVVVTRRRSGRAAVAVALLALGVTTFVAGRWSLRVVGPAASEALVSAAPRFQRLTFRRGWIQKARFAPDGDTVLYAAEWDGRPVEQFLVRSDSAESRPLGLQADLHAVSRSGEMAIAVRPRSMNSNYQRLGTLARVPLTGGAPREVLEDVQWADWSPDGQQLAIVREIDRRWKLEFPIGRVLYETPGMLVNLRVSPRGDAVALFEGRSVQAGTEWSVTVLDASGTRRVLSDGWFDWWYLSWSPAGDEIWFGASDRGGSHALHAVDLAGRRRFIFRGTGPIELHDISRSGVVLAAEVTQRRFMSGLPQGQSAERDLSWHDGSLAADLSPDGKTIVFREVGDAGGLGGAVFVRSMDGSPPVRLGEGSPRTLSPDGKWVIVWNWRSLEASLLPIGAGQPRQLGTGKLEDFGWADWFPDGQRILFAGREPGRRTRLYTLDLQNSELNAITGEGVDLAHPLAPLAAGHPISPDGHVVVAFDSELKALLLPTGGGEPRTLPGLLPGEVPIQWTSDGRSLYVFRTGELPAHLFKIDIATGHRTPWKNVAPADRTGVNGIQTVRITPDGRSYVYSYYSALSDLYIVEGLK